MQPTVDCTGFYFRLNVRLRKKKRTRIKIVFYFRQNWVYNKRKEKTTPNRQEDINMKHVCDVCGWVYDEELGYPEGGIAPGTKFEDLPEDFACPLCSVGKDMFSEE